MIQIPFDGKKRNSSEGTTNSVNSLQEAVSNAKEEVVIKEALKQMQVNAESELARTLFNSELRTQFQSRD